MAVHKLRAVTLAETVAGASVTYRLKCRESVSHGLRWLADEELRSALHDLRSVDAKQRDDAVHQGRKSIKKVRALLEVVRADVGRQYKKDKAALRMAARPLSQERDAKILLETFDDLRAPHRTQLRPATWAAIRRSLEALAADTRRRVLRPAAITRTLHTLDTVRHDSQSWSVDTKGFRALRPALKRSYARARNALRGALADPSPANLHRWRKRVKTHWYHVRLVEGAAPRRLGPYLTKLHHLESWLGDHHNLVVLDQRIKAGDFPPSMHEEIARLCALIERRQLRLRKQASALGVRLYAERATTFVRRLERLWHRWRC